MRNPLVVILLTHVLKIVFLLVAIAYYTLAERKVRAAIQRRRGPNVVGIAGLLQPLADGLKLIAKERIIPSHANSRIFVLAPRIVLTLALRSWGVLPFGCLDHSEYRSNSERVLSVFEDPSCVTGCWIWVWFKHAKTLKESFWLIAGDRIEIRIRLRFFICVLALLWKVWQGWFIVSVLLVVCFVVIYEFLLILRMPLPIVFITIFCRIIQLLWLFILILKGIGLRWCTFPVALVFTLRSLLFPQCSRLDDLKYWLSVIINGRVDNVISIKRRLHSRYSFLKFVHDYLEKIPGYFEALENGLVALLFCAGVYSIYIGVSRLVKYIKTRWFFVGVLAENSQPSYADFKYLTEANTVGDVRYGLLFILALSSRTVYGIIISGWASNSKYAFLGALRSAAQRISYEVSISLIILPIRLVSGSLNFVELVQEQITTTANGRGLLSDSGVYVISRIAETNRTPFDLPEAEAELVSGYNIDYSSIIFARFFLGEYGNRIRRAVQKCLAFLAGIVKPGLQEFAEAISSSSSLSGKARIFCFLFILVRATLPRYRYDQLRDIGWKTFLPLTTGFFVLIVGSLKFSEALPQVFELKPIDYAESSLFAWFKKAWSKYKEEISSGSRYGLRLVSGKPRYKLRSELFFFYPVQTFVCLLLWLFIVTSVANYLVNVIFEKRNIHLIFGVVFFSIYWSSQ